MKKYVKNMWVSYVLAFVISFMFFIVEPIQMYANNTNDFWFNLSIISKSFMILFLITFLFIVIINNILFFINKKVNNVFNVITFICFICTYIQGNFLASNLPALDGSVIDWSKNNIDSIISIVLWLIVITASVITIIKFKINNYLKVCGYISLTVFVMLFSSLVTTLLTTDVLNTNDEAISISTFKNINNYSSNDNFIILLLDAVDSTYFKEALDNNPEYKESFKDFTYFRDTMSMVPYTHESIPQILSGHTYENAESYLDYYKNAMNNSSLLDNLYKNDYNVNIYEAEFKFNDLNSLKISNIVNCKSDSSCNLDFIVYTKNQLKYILFRYLPYPLKRFSRIEGLDFLDSLTIDNTSQFYDENKIFRGMYLDYPLNIVEKNNFKFIHLAGAHVPFTYNKNMEEVANASYVDEVEYNLALASEYLNVLKENNVYDNSRIIIMADHGFRMDETEDGTSEGRQNPILFIKGKNETHKKMKTSDKMISYDDLSDAYIDLINNKKSTKLFKDISNERKRRYLFYTYLHENKMTEYETTGHAWETEKLTKTGREFIRK